MADREIIEDAYTGKVHLIFDTFFNALLTAQDAAEREQAGQAFQRGISKAREVRDLAIELLP